MARPTPSKRPQSRKETLYQLDCLLEFVSPGELRDHLLEIYQCYIIHEHESLPGDFKRMALSIQVLFDFLKYMENEGK